MKHYPILLIIFIYLISIMAVLNIEPVAQAKSITIPTRKATSTEKIKLNKKPTPTKQAKPTKKPTSTEYVPTITPEPAITSPVKIAGFTQNEVIVYYFNVPNFYAGINGTIWIYNENDTWYKEIELSWKVKIGDLGVWQGIIPPVPVSGKYILKGGLIFHEPYGNPAIIPPSDYTLILNCRR